MSEFLIYMFFAVVASFVLILLFVSDFYDNSPPSKPSRPRLPRCS